MAIDASIPLNIKQQADPLDQAAKAMTLKHLSDQNAMLPMQMQAAQQNLQAGQQQLQTGQLQNQRLQQQMGEEEAIKKAFVIGQDGKLDAEATFTNMSKVNPKLANEWFTNKLKNDESLQKSLQERYKRVNEDIGNIAAPIQARVDELVAQGIPLEAAFEKVKPMLAGSYAHLKEIYPKDINGDPSQMTSDQLRAMAMKNPAYMKAHLDKQPQPTNEQRNIESMLIAKGLKKGTPEFAKAAADEMQKVLTKKEGLTQVTVNQGSAIPARDSDKTGEDYLKTLPQSERNIVKGIAEGRINPQTLSTKGGHREKILSQVAQYDPAFDQQNYNQRAAVRKDFTSGTASKNVTAINTAIGHLGTMSELADKLGNKDIRAINQVANSIGFELGKDAVGNFEIAKGAVADELMRVFRGVGASQQEAEDWKAKFKAASSPKQFKGAIKTATELLGSRIEALDDQWKRGMGTDKGYPKLLSDKSRATFEKVGGKLSSFGQQGGSNTDKTASGAPNVGTVQDGYKFKGGDPSKKENWEKVN